MMEKTYVIAWKSRSCASFGQSKERLTREEAEQLVKELNRHHQPNFIHEPLNLASTAPALAKPGMSINNTAAVRNITFASALSHL